MPALANRGVRGKFSQFSDTRDAVGNYPPRWKHEDTHTRHTCKNSLINTYLIT